VRIVAIIASALFPGAGHIVIGRQLKGILLSLLFTLAFMLAFFRFFVAWPERSVAGDGLFLLGAAACGAVWVWAILDLYNLLFGLRRTAPRAEVDQHLREGITHYLRGELTEAERELALAAQLAPRDADVRIHLARVYRASGLKGKYRRLLRKCRSLDAEEKWAAEIEEGLAEK
jgi:hypothetical protein